MKKRPPTTGNNAPDTGLSGVADEGQFEKMFASAPNAMLMVGQDGTIAYANHQAEKLLRYAPGQLIGTKVEQLVPDSIRGEHDSLRKNYAKRATVRAMGANRDLFAMRRDGTLVPVEIGLTPIDTTRGQMVLAALVDLSERKAANDRFFQMFASAPYAMLMIASDGNIVHVNAQAERLLGYTASDLVDKSVEQLVPEHVRGNHHNLRAGYATDPTTRAMGANRDLFARRSDGREVPVEIGLTPIKTESGDMVLAALIDLSERKALEKRFSRMFASAPNAMLMIGPNGIIVHANHQAENLLGYEVAELIGIPVEQLVPDHVRGGHAALRHGYASKPATRAMGANRDLYARRRDASEVPVEIGLTPIETDDGTMVLVALIDLSERKAAEVKLRERAAALERSNRELDNFAYVASHDLKAPLRGINQLAGFIMEDAGHALPEESRQDLELLRGRVERLESLLDGLLQYSRIGRKESEPEWVDINALITNVAELYVPAERFRVDVQPGMPRIYSPRTAVEIVVRNLLMNSVKHHDRERGEIRITYTVDRQRLELSFTDDGPGIPSQFSEKVFQLFQTLKARDKVEGSGMGLALVKKTVENQGGSVALVPNNERGATFRLTWPIDNSVNKKKAA